MPIKLYKGYLTESGIVSTTGTPMLGTVYFVIQDSKGIIWIATKGDGLVRAEPTSSNGMSYKLTRYLHREEDMYSLSDNNVYCIYEDHYGRIWVATLPEVSIISRRMKQERHCLSITGII